MTHLTAEQITRRTYRWDLLRGSSIGVLESCWQVFALVVAIRVFDASSTVKGLIAAAFAIGLILTPFTLGLAVRSGHRTGLLCGLLNGVTALSLGASTLVAGLIGFVTMIALAQIAQAQSVPLQTHIYASNYPNEERGRRFSHTFLLASIIGAAMGIGGGALLDHNIDNWRWLFLLGLIAACIASFAFMRMPSQPLPASKRSSPWDNLSLAWKDKLFGTVLLAWMMMGLGNLMTMPLRAEYLANPIYGINASNEQIGLLMLTLPLAARILAGPLWGILFDRINLIVLRIFLNFSFIASILLFFLSKNFWLMAAAAIFFGIASAGGRIMWSLWVTKIAPPSRVSQYMSVHTLMTGLRGALAPFLGFWLIAETTPQVAAWVGASLSMISILIFIPLIPIMRDHTPHDPDAPAVEREG